MEQLKIGDVVRRISCETDKRFIIADITHNETEATLVYFEGIKIYRGPGIKLYDLEKLTNLEELKTHLPYENTSHKKFQLNPNVFTPTEEVFALNEEAYFKQENNDYWEKVRIIKREIKYQIEWRTDNEGVKKLDVQPNELRKIDPPRPKNSIGSI